jgi:hypothetical protein
MSDPNGSPYTSHLRLLVLFGVTLSMVIGAVVLVAWLKTQPAPAVQCRHPGCGRPPSVPTPTIEPAPVPSLLPNASWGDPNYVPDQPVPVTQQPVQTGPRFTAPDGSWSVAYPAKLQPLPAGTKSVGFTMTDSHGDKTQVVFFGQPARDRSAQDMVHILIQKCCPGAMLGYQIPNAMVGYQAGYGEFDDFTPQSGSGSFSNGRAMAVVAVKNGLALGVLAFGPKYQYKPPDDPTSHPSAADLLAANTLGPYVNSFMWKGDPPR